MVNIIKFRPIFHYLNEIDQVLCSDEKKDIVN